MADIIDSDKNIREAVAAYAADREKNDKPVLEIYPWWAVASIAGLWGALWFGFWALFRGFLASFIVLLGSPLAPRWLAYPLPLQFFLWLGCVLSVQHSIRNERNPSWFTITASLVLLSTWPATAFFMLDLLSQFTQGEQFRNAISVHLLHVMDLHLPDYIAFAMATLVGALSVRGVLRWKYRRLPPCHPRHMYAGWLIGIALGTMAALKFGTLYWFIITGAIGSAVSIREFRRTIKQGVEDV